MACGASFRRARAEELALRGRHLHLVRPAPTRDTFPVERVCRWPAPGRRRRPRRSASATPPGWPTRSRCAPSSSGRGRELGGGGTDGLIPQHSGQGLANVSGGAGRPGWRALSRASASWAGARSRPGRPATSPPRTWSPMLEEMGIATGIDLTRLLDASRAAQEALGRSLGSHVLSAGPVRLALMAADHEDALAAHRALAGRRPAPPSRQGGPAGQAPGARAGGPAARPGLVCRGALPAGRRGPAWVPREWSPESAPRGAERWR